MFLLGFRRKLTALTLCKSIESAIQWFQIHHRITFATIQNPAVYLSGARVSFFSTLVPRLSTFTSLRRVKCTNILPVRKFHCWTWRNYGRKLSPHFPSFKIIFHLPPLKLIAHSDRNTHGCCINKGFQI